MVNLFVSSMNVLMSGAKNLKPHQDLSNTMRLIIMTVKKLINPLTENYKKFKEVVNDLEFPWQWIPGSVNYSKQDEGYVNKGYYTHAFLLRPESGDMLFPKQHSQHLMGVHHVMMEILLSNNIRPATFYRMSVNCDHPHESDLPNVPHVDHEFPHDNLLIYLSDPKGGYTMVEDEKYFGKEDDAILFSGKHCNASPKTGRRVVSVTTFLKYGS